MKSFLIALYAALILFTSSFFLRDQTTEKQVNALELVDAVKKLDAISQQHVLTHWDQLAPLEKAQLLADIDRLDPLAFFLQKKALTHKSSSSSRVFDPLTNYASSGNIQDREEGLRLIAEGKAACLLIAGGQGTRLGIDGPKGICAVSVVKQKSLFQLFSEKVIAAGKQASRLLPLAIMTSPLNHQATYDFFLEHDFFGLKPEQVFFFSQSMLPFLDQEGNLFLEAPYKIAYGPDGNGSSLKYLVDSGIWKQWKEQGIRYVNHILIDNPLADPYDAELIGFHHRQSAEVTVKGTLRRHAKEKVGMLIKEGGKIQVIEYSELPEPEGSALNGDGSLTHRCASLSLFCFSMDFIQEAARRQHEMPLHLALKKATALNPQGKQEAVTACKFETFIFDLLPFANRANVLLYPREECFAPLKNLTGEDTLADVQLALQNKDKRVFEQIFGREPPPTPFELAQEFHYATPELLKQWQALPMPTGSYIRS